jgi:hypothetical protein
MEVDAGIDYLINVLSHDSQMVTLTGGQVYEEEAPREATWPFVILSMRGAEDVSGANDQRCMVTTDMLVYVVGLATDMTNLQSAADRLDALLQNSSGVLPVLHISRMQPYRASGWVGDVQFKNLGGFYRLEIGA